jgi:hypothetical protein
MSHQKRIPIVKKNGEVNGSFGAFCNKVMQIGGTGVVLISLPSLCGIVYQNYTNSIRMLSVLESIEVRLEHTVTNEKFESEIKRIERETVLNDERIKFLLQRGDKG